MMGHYDDEPWVDYKKQSWHLQGKSAGVVVLDEYTQNLSDALGAHMTEQYKQSALDKLFGIRV
jgi:hypothetical protein